MPAPKINEPVYGGSDNMISRPLIGYRNVPFAHNAVELLDSTGIAFDLAFEPIYHDSDYVGGKSRVGPTLYFNKGDRNVATYTPDVRMLTVGDRDAPLGPPESMKIFIDRRSPSMRDLIDTVK